MKKIVYCSLLALFFSLLSFGQEDGLEPLIVDQLDVRFILRNNIAIHQDTTRKLNFEEIQNTPFKKWNNDIFDYQAKNWFKFYLNPTIDAKQFIFSSSYSDSVNVFVPYQTSYQKKTIGRLTNKDIRFSIYDSSILTIPTDSIDYSKPFYFNKVALTKTPQGNANILGYVILANKFSTWKNVKDKIIGYTLTENIFYAVLFVTMLIFLVNYAVTRDQNFLNYSLYLLFTLSIFIYSFPFIVNVLNDIHPLIIDSISHASVPLASGAYFYFVIYFINVKDDFPKLYPIAKYTVLASIIFAALFVIQLFFFPYFKFRTSIHSAFDVAFLITSISVFIYLVLQRLDFLKRIIIFGSFFLILGQTLSITLSNAFYFLGAVIIEIIVFASVVSFQNKRALYNQAISEAALANEKIKRENLQEIDNLKSRFITNITHEFRTPLTIILGYVDNLKATLNYPKNGSSDLEIIERNSTNLLNLVNEMLDLAKLEQGSLDINYRKADLSKFTKIITESFESLAFDKGINIAYSNVIKNPILDFDSEKMRQILSNLLSNAIKFTEHGDTIKVKLSDAQDHYQLTVSDTGAGIPENEIDFIFDRFYQVKNNSFKVSQGTGVGLAFTKELVQLLQGTIAVQSQIDKGTTFTLRFPLTRTAHRDDVLPKVHVQTPEEQPTEVTTQEMAPQEMPTVLVVEDNRDMSKYICSCLQGLYHVTTAFNGTKGFDKAIKETPDIIISDVMMPKMDGYEMTQKLQEHEATNHIPIILLTSKSQQEDKLEGISRGADAYLIKPFQKAELLLRLEKLISKRNALQKRYQLSNVLLDKKEKHIKDHNIVFLNKAITCVHKDIANPEFNSQLLAQELALSDSQLYRKLKAITNNSTAIFIRNVRLEKSKELLESSSKTVSEIAYECGFKDPNWFGKIFKERYKLNPSSYRNSSKNNV